MMSLSLPFITLHFLSINLVDRSFFLVVKSKHLKVFFEELQVFINPLPEAEAPSCGCDAWWCGVWWGKACGWDFMGSHGCCFCLGSLKTIRFVAKKGGDGHGEKPAFHLKLEISSLEFGFPRFFPQTQKTIFHESRIQVMMALYFATCCLWCFSALS